MCRFLAVEGHRSAESRHMPTRIKRGHAYNSTGYYTGNRDFKSCILAKRVAVAAAVAAEAGVPTAAAAAAAGVLVVVVVVVVGGSSSSSPSTSSSAPTRRTESTETLQTSEKSRLNTQTKCTTLACLSATTPAPSCTSRCLLPLPVEQRRPATWDLEGNTLFRLPQVATHMLSTVGS